MNSLRPPRANLLVKCSACKGQPWRIKPGAGLGRISDPDQHGGCVGVVLDPALALQDRLLSPMSLSDLDPFTKKAAGLTGVVDDRSDDEIDDAFGASHWAGDLD